MLPRLALVWVVASGVVAQWAGEAWAARFATPAEVATCQAKLLEDVPVRLVGTLGERTVRPDAVLPELIRMSTPVDKRVTCHELVKPMVTVSLLRRDAAGVVMTLGEKPLLRSDQEEREDFLAGVNGTYRYFQLSSRLTKPEVAGGVYGAKFVIVANANPEWLKPGDTAPPQIRELTTWLTATTVMPRRRPISQARALRLFSRSYQRHQNWYVLLNTNIQRQRNRYPPATGSWVESGPFGDRTYQARWREAVPRGKAFLLVNANTTRIFGTRYYLYEPKLVGKRGASWINIYRDSEDGTASEVVFLLRPKRK